MPLKDSCDQLDKRLETYLTMNNCYDNNFSATTIPYRSGAGLNAFNLAKELQKQGYSVRIVCFSQGKDSFYECIESIDIWRMPCSQTDWQGFLLIRGLHFSCFI